MSQQILMKQIFYLKIPYPRKFLNSQSGKRSQSVEVSQENHIEQNISQENSISRAVQEVHIKNSPQVTKEITEQTQNINQSHNESILNEPQNQKIEQRKKLSQ